MTFRFLHTAVEFERRSRRDKFLQLQSAAVNSDRDSFLGGQCCGAAAPLIAVQ